ncbi:MAG: hypothetical protein GY679_01330 [Mycoplasma sp.]|nr:hypothetical protein [Mycoplasma sp.]
MGFYDDIKSGVADPLLKQFGQELVCQRKTGTVYDPIEGKNVGLYDNLCSGYGLQTDYKAMDINGTAIKKGDKKLIYTQITNLTENIKTNDRVILDGVEWNVIEPGEVRPAVTRIIYKLQIRQG